MSVYVVNDFYTTPKICVTDITYNAQPIKTAEQIADMFEFYTVENSVTKESGTIYFEFPSEQEFLTQEVLDRMEGEKNSFIKWFVRGFEDFAFYGYGFADQAHHPGYEDGMALGSKEFASMDFGDAYDIGFMLFDARLWEENR